MHDVQEWHTRITYSCLPTCVPSMHVMRAWHTCISNILAIHAWCTRMTCITYTHVCKHEWHECVPYVHDIHVWHTSIPYMHVNVIMTPRILQLSWGLMEIIRGAINVLMSLWRLVYYNLVRGFDGNNKGGNQWVNVIMTPRILQLSWGFDGNNKGTMG